MNARVKRCPYCNSHNLALDRNNACSWIRCFECGATGPTTLRDNAAIELFNHGVENPSALVASRKSNRDDLKMVDL